MTFRRTTWTCDFSIGDRVYFMSSFDGRLDGVVMGKYNSDMYDIVAVDGHCGWILHGKDLRYA